MTKEEILKALSIGKRVVTPIDTFGYWEVITNFCGGQNTVWYHKGRCAMTDGTWFDFNSDGHDDILERAIIIDKI